MSNNLTKWMTILTNLAVIGGIGFLILETQQNNTLLRLEARHAASASMRELVLSNMNSDELILARSKAAKGEPLTESESTRIQLFFFTLFRSWQSEYFNYMAGVMSEEEMVSLSVTWRRTIQTPYIQSEWQRHMIDLDPGFVEFMEPYEQ